MAHYAYLDENNLVTIVIVGKDEGEDGINWEEYYGAKRTSYNTIGGVHTNGGIPFRKNFAGIGYTYDESRDAFISPKPFDSWLLDEETCLWHAQKPMPEPKDGIYYNWDEPTLTCVEITI